MGVRCLWDFLALFRPCFERVIAQVCHDLRLVGSGREHLVAFPAAERDRANSQCTSSLRLVEFELKPAAAKVATNGGWFFWNLNSTVVGW